MDIKLTRVSKHFQDKLLFEDLNLTFPEGKMNCLMGPSGSGKSTIINVILGLIKPDSGEVTGTEGKLVAAVFQEDRLIEHWDAIKNVKLVCDKSVTTNQILEELKEVGLEESLNKPVRDYSGGMRRRVAIVRAMLAQSDLIILDEPFQGLDDMLKEQVIDYVRRKTLGKTVILVTHDREEAERLGAELINLDDVIRHVN
jgi:NitT/TauT family transport system ATP-binding protein